MPYLPLSRVQEALIHIGKPAIKPLASALRSSDRSVRSGAAVTLAALGDARALDFLLAEGLQDERYWRTAQEPIGRLVNLDPHWTTSGMAKRSVPQLVVALTGAKNPDVRIWAAKLLGKIGDDRAITPL